MKKQLSAVAMAILISAITLLVLLRVLASPLDAAPTVTEVDPASITNDVDNPIIISGADFAAILSGTEIITPPTVYLDTTSLGNAGWVSTTSLTITVPIAFPVGVYTVTVTNPDGQSDSLPEGLTVSYPAPVLQGMSPVSGTYGQSTLLTITGTGFVTTPMVFLHETPCSAYYISSTTLTTTVPSNLLPGTHDLTVHNPGPGDSGDILPNAFTLLSPIPSVLAVAPDSAPNDFDSQIVITGTGFAPTPTLHLGATPLEQVSWISLTRLTAVVPWGLDAGTYPLTVTNPSPGAVSTVLSEAFTLTQGIGMWTTQGPYGGEMLDIAMNPVTPTTLYASAFDTGIFVSEDAAKQWKPAVVDAWAMHMAIDPNRPEVMYASGQVNLLRTMDSGKSWERLPLGPPYALFFYPVAHPITPGVAYVGAYDYHSTGHEGGFYRLENWGNTWTTMTNGLTDTHVSAIALHPDDPDVIIAGTKHGNMFLSINGGNLWQWVAQLNGFVKQVAFDPFGGDNVWAVTGIDGSDPPYLYKSPYPGSSTWSPVALPFSTGRVNSLTFHPTISGTIWLATETGYISTDGGSNWSPITSRQREPGEFVIDPTNPSIIYASSIRNGVDKSTDGGATWQISEQGIAGVVPHAMAVSPQDPYEIYVSTASLGILTSNNGGQSWQETGTARYITPGWPKEDGVLAFDHVTPTRLYLGDRCPDSPYDVPCVRISEDGAQSWNDISLPVPAEFGELDGETYAVAPHPNRPGHVLAGVSFHPGFDNAETKGQIYASEDYGNTWMPVTTTQPISAVTHFAHDALDADSVYAGTSGTGLWKSSDGGANWQPMASWPGCSQIIVLAAHPHRSGWLYAQGKWEGGICESQLLFSSDGGETWQVLQDDVDLYLRKFLVMPDNTSTLYVGSSGSGLYRSRDNGQTWEHIASLPGDAIVYALAAGMDEERVVLYVASSAGLATSAAQADNAENIAAEIIPGVDSVMNAGVYRLSTRRLNQHTYLPLVLR